MGAIRLTPGLDSTSKGDGDVQHRFRKEKLPIGLDTSGVVFSGSLAGIANLSDSPNYPEKPCSSNLLIIKQIDKIKLAVVTLHNALITNCFELPQKTRQFPFIDY